MTKVKTQAEIADMRTSGLMLASVLAAIKAHTKAGITTKGLANLAAKELRRLGGLPAFRGYQGFPDVLCVSVNDEVVHGIPRADKIISDGDIVSLDFGVEYHGMITDAAISVGVGRITTATQRLIEATERSLLAGIDVVRDGTKTGDIGNAVENILKAGHYGIVRDLVGHGVGHNLHEEPNIPNYGVKGTGTALKKHMTVAIEPMATLGREDVYIAEDGWTVRTKDGSWAAHFEHTVLVTEAGPEILTTLA